MMTLTDAIMHAEECAERCEKLDGRRNQLCAEDHRQLAEWLKELQKLREDRPKGDVDAVAIFEREMHNLEQGYITIGEFDERIEPLRHLCYGRPQEWIPCSERMPEYMTPVLTWDGTMYAVEKRIPYVLDEDGEPIEAEWWVSDDYDGEVETDYYPGLNDGVAIAWMPLPKPWKGEKDV